MAKDALARRLSFAPPQPVARRLVLTEADLLAFAAIDRHGPLPTPYLRAFTRHVRRDYSQLQNRLTELYNGTRAQPPWLTRPQQQFASFHARYQHLVYDLAPQAKLALGERGWLERWSPKRTDPFVHRLMLACAGASLELGAKGRWLRHIRREEILGHGKAARARQAANPLAIPLPAIGAQRALVPDDLFGLEYPGVGYRFFAVEIDRNTESIERKALTQTAFGRKVAGYLQLLRAQIHRDWWGVPNLTILTLTTNEVHRRNMLVHVAGQDEPGLAGRFAFACETGFGANWRGTTGAARPARSALIDDRWESRHRLALDANFLGHARMGFGPAASRVMRSLPATMTCMGGLLASAAQDPCRIGKRTRPKLGKPNRGISGRAKPRHLLCRRCSFFLTGRLSGRFDGTDLGKRAGSSPFPVWRNAVDYQDAFLSMPERRPPTCPALVRPVILPTGRHGRVAGQSADAGPGGLGPEVRVILLSRRQHHDKFTRCTSGFAAAGTTGG